MEVNWTPSEVPFNLYYSQSTENEGGNSDTLVVCWGVFFVVWVLVGFL